jgi:hypothetical protein
LYPQRVAATYAGQLEQTEQNNGPLGPEDTVGTQAEWKRFEKILKTEERYFSKTAEETLSL